MSAKLEVAVSCLPLNGIGLLAVYGVLGGNSSFILRTPMNYAKLLTFETEGIKKVAP